MAIKKAQDPKDSARQLAQAKKLLRRELSLEGEDAKKPIPLSPLAQKKLARRKKRMKLFIRLGIVALLGYGWWWLFKPAQSSIEYGICKVFVELTVPYPYTIHYSEVIRLNDGSVRIWYSYYDSFGDYRLLPTQCFYGPDEKGNKVMTKAIIGRREVDPSVVSRFNTSLPAILAYPPDLTHPTRLPNDPKDLQFDFDAYRKKIF